ncbi:hypothetical protein E4U51_004460 [Claviceps purpurea]|nr:hypothetical protein E4U51_004460 [Claviceps purpurea]
MDVKRRNSTVGPRAQVKCLTRDMMPDYLSMFSGLVTEDWERSRSDIDPKNATKIQIDNRIAYLYNYYVTYGKTFEMLQYTFCEDCEYWTVQTRSRASRRACQELRDLLTTNDIYVGNGSGSKRAARLRRVVMRYMRDAVVCEAEDVDEEDFDDEDDKH